MNANDRQAAVLRWLERVAFVLVLLLAAFIAWATCGCTSTVHPDLVVPAQASADGTQVNSGVVMTLKDPAGVLLGYLVTDHFRDRYNSMVKVYGYAFAPSLVENEGMQHLGDDRWAIDVQHFNYFAQMNLWRKSGITPTKP